MRFKKKLILTLLVSEEKAKYAIKSDYKLVKCDLKKLGNINDAIIDKDLVHKNCHFFPSRHGMQYMQYM